MALQYRADHDDIEIQRDQFWRQAGDVPLYREYAAGKHKRTLTPDQQSVLEELLDNEFCDNLCRRVISTNAARLEFLRWNVDDVKTGDYLEDLFVKMAVDDRSGEVHYDTLRDGNHALLLSWDNEKERVVMQREPWWDGNTGVYIAYDTQGDPLYAVKQWTDLEYMRRWVWFSDQLERYMHDGKSWIPYALEGEQTLPQPWLKQDSTPLHIPLVHFANAGQGSGNYGTSELAGGVLGSQDQVNDTRYSMAAAARFTGFQILYILGLPVADENGKEIPFTVGPNQAIRSELVDAKVGYVPAGSLSELISLYQTQKQAIADMTSTPLYAITGGQWPSGEALIRADEPLVNKARTQIKKLKYRWSTVAHRACEIANTYGRAGLNEDALITSTFSPPERRDLLTLATIADRASKYVSDKEGLRIMGKTEAEVDKIAAERQAQAPVAVTERIQDAVTGGQAVGDQGAQVTQLNKAA